MKKKAVYMIILLLSLGLFSACSKPDEETIASDRLSTEARNSDNVTVDPVQEDSIIGEQSTTNQDSSGEKVDFQLQNENVDFQLQGEDGIECYDFKEGDNIIFRLEIKNDTDEDAWLPPFTDIIGHDVFRVYSQSGEEIGTPWDGIWSSMVGSGFIGAHCSVVFFCPWFDIPALYFQGHEHFYSAYSFYKTDEKSPLPQGDYYSKFDIKLNNKTITCNRNFKIQ
jgi:hypothetical protein